MQLSTLNGSGWPSWDIQPEPFNILWAGHRPLRRGSKTGSASGPVEAQSHGAAGRIPLRELWEYVKCDGLLDEMKRPVFLLERKTGFIFIGHKILHKFTEFHISILPSGKNLR